MAFSELQYTSQHCAVGNPQLQAPMPYYPAINNNYQGQNQVQQQWYHDHNANEGYQPAYNMMGHRQNIIENSHHHQQQQQQQRIWNQNQQRNNLLTSSNEFVVQGNANQPNYRRRINSAASDGCPTLTTNQWMAAPSPNMWSPNNNLPRSRQPSFTDSSMPPDNFYQPVPQYNPSQPVVGSFPNQVQPMGGPYMGVPSPRSTNSISPPNLTQGVMDPIPVDGNTQQNSLPVQPIPQSGKASDWSLDCMGVSMKLANQDLWKKFENVTIEMVISKHGRRMFPILDYELNGLDPNKLYNVFLDFVLANNYVWKYVNQSWNATGLASNEEPGFHPGQRVYLHPDSPATGDVWNKKGASFNKMKLSNHLHNEKEKIITLRTLHKYQPRLHVVEVDRMNPNFQSNLRTFVLPKTTFMSVTLYHDTDVAQLKINLNPFARSFRDKTISISSKSNDGNSSSNSSTMSQTPSPLTPSEDNDSSRISDVGRSPNQIVKIENPVNVMDLERAKQFLNKQLSVMSQLVQKSEELERNSKRNEGKGIKLNKADPFPSIPSVRSGESLEELLNTPTVHHLPPGGEKKKDAVKSNGSTIADYQLLNVDRCFPPNAVAPLSKSLPFDPEQLKAKANSGPKKDNLPTFYECSYYREQAAAEAKKRQMISKESVPVVYIPAQNNSANSVTKTATVSPNNNFQPVSVVDSNVSPNNNTTHADMTSYYVPPADVTSLPPTDLSPLRAASQNFTLPTLSPGCLRDIFQGEFPAIGEFPTLPEEVTSLKRKHSINEFDDVDDDDVFLSPVQDFDFMGSQAKRSCFTNV